MSWRIPGRWRIPTLLACTALAACGPAGGDARIYPTLPTLKPAGVPLRLPTVVLVTLDGVRADDVFDPSLPLPHLRALAARGVALGGRDSPIAASGPRFVSLPGYREILTGRRDDAGACRDNDCAPLAEPTILDELRLAGRLAPDDVAVIASWETIARATSAAPDALTVSAGRHAGSNHTRLAAAAPAVAAHLAEGARARAFPGHGDYRPDAHTVALALAVAAARHPRLLWVALGDCDEYAHRGDASGYRAALVAADAFLGGLVAIIGDDAIYMVTADHGRAANFRDHGDAPESAAVWLVAAGGDIPARAPAPALAAGQPAAAQLAAPPARLADIAPSLRALVGLAADPSPRAGRAIAALLPLRLAERN